MVRSAKIPVLVIVEIENEFVFIIVVVVIVVIIIIVATDDAHVHLRTASEVIIDSGLGRAYRQGNGIVHAHAGKDRTTFVAVVSLAASSSSSSPAVVLVVVVVVVVVVVAVVDEVARIPGEGILQRGRGRRTSAPGCGVRDPERVAVGMDLVQFRASSPGTESAHDEMRTFVSVEHVHLQPMADLEQR